MFSCISHRSTNHRTSCTSGHVVIVVVAVDVSVVFVDDVDDNDDADAVVSDVVVLINTEMIVLHGISIGDGCCRTTYKWRK